jgi:RNA polymerase sigma-70 factor (sigma-E family)
MRRQDEFEEFVGAQLPGLLGYARALSGNDHDAWDLVQECLVRIGVRWSRMDRDGNPAAYARTTLVRLNVDRMRRRGRERPVELVPEVAVEHPVPGIDPWMLAALRSLPPRQRTALVLRYVDDLDLRGIAAAMGCSVGTAKSHVSRGLAALRQRAPAGSSLADHLNGGPDVRG